MTLLMGTLKKVPLILGTPQVPTKVPSPVDLKIPRDHLYHPLLNPMPAHLNLTLLYRRDMDTCKDYSLIVLFCDNCGCGPQNLFCLDTRGSEMVCMKDTWMEFSQSSLPEMIQDSNLCSVGPLGIMRLQKMPGYGVCLFPSFLLNKASMDTAVRNRESILGST